MSGGELRESVALLAEEWRVLALGLCGPLVYATWVVASGLVLEAGTPALKRAVATTVAGTPVRGLELFALLAWIVLPSLAAIALVQRQLFNRHDNLANSYRMAEPGVLLVVPSLALVGCLAALVVSGWSLPLVAALLVVTVHFLVRTVAFGHRVYTLSLTRTLLGMIAVSAVSVVVGLLVRLSTVTGLDPRLASRVATAGVADAVQTWTALIGIESALLLRGTLFVPIALSVCYLLAQTTVASIAKRRGLPSAPKRRPGQRVPESAQPSAASSATRVVSNADTATEATGDADGTAVTDPESDPTPDSAGDADGTGPTTTPSETADGDDEHSGTRVFTPTEPVPSADDPGEQPTETDGRSGGAEAARTSRNRVLPIIETTEAYRRSGDGTHRRSDAGDTIPRFEPAADTDSTNSGNQTDEQSDSNAVLPEFDSDPTASGPVDRDERAEIPVSDTGTENGADDSVRAATAVVPRFEAAHEYAAVSEFDQSATPVNAETIIADTGSSPDESLAAPGTSESEPSAATNGPAEIDCPSCGRRVENSAEVCYCPGCGTALDTGAGR
ncbi:hypothetical protein [Haloarcula halophila]|uniref:hypothetical protein n=1 Tax=Haloarcula TaxID=2237 RepID=UPI0023E3760B|nr:hypothetical protein [Halomicroarcula sp. DFY41]